MCAKESLLLRLALLLSTLIICDATVSASETGWPIKQLPFQPYLVTDTNSGLCKAVLEEMNAQFLSDRVAIDTSKMISPDAGEVFNWVKWELVKTKFSKEYSDNIYRAALDLNGDGKKEVVVYRSYEWSWRGPTYSGFVFNEDSAFAEALKSGTSMENILEKGVQYYSGGAPSNSAWSWNNLYEYNGQYYFFNQSNDYWNIVAPSVNARKLNADGTTAVVCDVGLQPTKTEALFTSDPAIKVYVSLLNRMGNGGDDCGTAHFGMIHEQGARASLSRASIRPWAAKRDRDGDYYKYNERMEQFIQEWGYSDPWSYREVMTLNEARPHAIKFAERYLKDNFGMAESDAVKYSKTLIDDLTAAYFLIPSSYEDYYRNAKKFDELQKMISGVTNMNFKNDEFEFSIDSPRVMQQMYDFGADVDAVNSFGKTALMYAAHLDRPDTVNALLKLGADVNKATTKNRESFCSPMERTGRTALMYAAENASPEVILALVAAGADMDAKDSKGNQVDYYLKMNPGLDPEHRELPLRELVKMLKDNPIDGAPSFDCKKASTVIEKRICANSVLSLYDRNLNYAYHNWVSVSDNAKQVRQEQREWLGKRKATCGKIGDDYKIDACLVQITRARIRYLRMLESVSKQSK